LLAIVVMLAGVRAEAQQGGAPAGGAKTAGQSGKNIQVFKDLPGSQLNMVMDLMASSLGVRCGHCHMQDSSGWRFDDDAKNEKRQARKMIQMVMDLNAKNFGGRSAVTCYTCHHGSTEPLSVIPLPLVPAKPRTEETASAPALPALDVVIAKCEKGLGGADAMNKIKSRVIKGKSADGQGHEMPQEIRQLLPDRYLSSVTIREGVQRMFGFDGKTGWMSTPRGTRPMPPEDAENLRAEAALFPVQHLRDLKNVSHVREIDTANGARAYVVAAQVNGSTVEKYFIDTASGLLLRKVITTDTPIGIVPEQTDYSDYRAVDGVMVPFTVTKAAVDPRDGSVFRAASVEQNVSLDPKTFAMPEAKK
jgi:hypothetical protein